MTETPQLAEIISKIKKEGSAFDSKAFYFIYEALEYTMHKLEVRGHVSGQQLLEGIRRLALEKFGMLAPTVFNQWGVYKTEDFGRIVFKLVENNAMGRTEEDAEEDFQGVYDFDNAFLNEEELSKEWKIQD